MNTAGEFFLYAPQQRALLPVSGMHVSKTLAQTLRKGTFQITTNQAFDDVMAASVRDEENWITPGVRTVYGAIHRDGWGHSVECWRDGILAGGLYGIAIGGTFFVESMFSRVTDASKVALHHLRSVAAQQGFKLIDLQLMSDHLESLGAYSLSHETFVSELARALAVETAWGATPEVLAQRCGPPVLTTERLLIRPLTVEDAPAYHAHLADEDVQRHLLAPVPANAAAAARRIVALRQERYAEGIADPLGIALRTEPDDIIGTVGCFTPELGLPQLEIAFDIARPLWGKGYATEAARALLGWALDHHDVRRIRARCVAGNAASARTLAKIGMSYEGTLQSAMYFGGQTFDMKYFALVP